MRNHAFIEIAVGLFIIVGCIALLALGYDMSNLKQIAASNGYTVTADFENIGSLKIRAPVTLSGVRIGEVSDITLDPKSFEAKVSLRINQRYNSIVASNATAKIQTAGLLGANYIALVPGYPDVDNSKPVYLAQGSQITNTQSALILEDMIGQLLYSFKNKS